MDERIGREFRSADEVESLPVGAVVIDSDGDGWQKGRSGSWYQSGEYGSAEVDCLAEEFAPLLLVWIPPGSELKPVPLPVDEPRRVALSAGGLG